MKWIFSTVNSLQRSTGPISWVESTQKRTAQHVSAEGALIWVLDTVSNVGGAWDADPVPSPWIPAIASFAPLRVEGPGNVGDCETLAFRVHCIRQIKRPWCNGWGAWTMDTKMKDFLASNKPITHLQTTDTNVSRQIRVGTGQYFRWLEGFIN
jgi:hypothetical protein